MYENQRHHSVRGEANGHMNTEAHINKKVNPLCDTDGCWEEATYEYKPPTGVGVRTVRTCEEHRGHDGPGWTDLLVDEREEPALCSNELDATYCEEHATHQKIENGVLVDRLCDQHYSEDGHADELGWEVIPT